METNLFFLFSSFFIFSAGLILGGKFLITKELFEFGIDKKKIKTALNIWFLGALFIVIFFSLYFYKHNISAAFILIYIFHYSFFISIIDFYTHSIYIETLPGLIPFLFIGYYTFGFKPVLYGVIGGIVINSFFVLMELFISGEKSYGFGDFVFSTAASGLVSWYFFLQYWTVSALLMFICFIAIITCIKIKGKKLTKGEFIPLLPILSFSSCLVYFLGVTGQLLPFVFF